MVIQLVKEFTAFCGTGRFITILTRDRHWNLRVFCMKNIAVPKDYTFEGLFL
jgi:hypothetical protein